ncbi:hypothetical protein ACU686_44360 [Yinghuangia aomiensis]
MSDTSLADAFDLVDLPYTPGTLAGDLSCVEQLLLALALAAAERARRGPRRRRGRRHRGHRPRPGLVRRPVRRPRRGHGDRHRDRSPPPGPSAADLVLRLPGHDVHAAARDAARDAARKGGIR